MELDIFCFPMLNLFIHNPIVIPSFDFHEAFEPRLMWKIDLD